MKIHPTKSRQRARQRGFTLIELMMTVVLAVILVGIAIPAFRGMMSRNRLVTQSNDLVSALTLARSEAITRNSTMTFCRTATAADTACAGSAANWRFWIVVNSAGQVVRRGDISAFNNTMRVTSNLTIDTMTFSSDGLARTGNPAALLTTQRLRVCVTAPSANENIRLVTPGAGSRISTTKSSGTC